MEKNEKNGVFSRVRSRWRSIFSKKANPVKLRDCNRLTFERILSDPDEPIGTIVAQATVNPIELPNGAGIALIQETTIYDEDCHFAIDKPSSSTITRNTSSLSRRFRRLSSGDLNVIRRMTEEIDFDLKNVIYDGNEITGEPDHENGNDRACFKPGPDHPIDQQMLFLKQCIKKVDTRPPNMYYLTNGWSVDNFEALFKYMIRTSEDCSRDTLLSIELRDVVVSLRWLLAMIEDYASFKGVAVHKDYVYATVHSKKPSLERKLRGAIDQFVEVETKVRRAKISYTSTVTISSPHTPHVSVVVRFCCQKPAAVVRGTGFKQVSVQVDQITGHRAVTPALDKPNGGIGCECVEIPADEEPPAPRQPPPVTTIITNHQSLVEEEEVPLQLSYHVNALTGETLVDCDVENDETDVTSDSTQDNDMHEFVEMFPVLLELFEKAGITDDVVKNEDDHEVDTEMPVLNSRFPRKKLSFFEGVTMSSDGCEDTRSMSDSSATDSVQLTDSSDFDSSDSEGEQSDVEADPSEGCDEKEDVQEENDVVSVTTEEKIEETPKDD
ncbi:hypothetical protein L3Y34_003750 [Caenorhabditis briggsae]|uniref:Uncharacterized protein n=1 Tax=Caenorhabditis briggsae TaxID=6238 RepID=A0AAE9D441_CAEBR|nr:hypothetical protein L3Y34_003750 [Caenorhabditis briggsae]